MVSVDRPAASSWAAVGLRRICRAARPRSGTGSPDPSARPVRRSRRCAVRRRGQVEDDAVVARVRADPHSGDERCRAGAGHRRGGLGRRGRRLRAGCRCGAQSGEERSGPYGKQLPTSGTMAGRNPLRFAAGEVNTRTNFVKFGVRYYDPNTGRFTQQDSIEVPRVSRTTTK